MLPRLEAEERLNGINDRAVAFGAADVDQRRRTFRALEKAARGGRRRVVKGQPRTFAGMGIGVRVAAAPVPSPATAEEASDA